jgi:hypothetical protein
MNGPVHGKSKEGFWIANKGTQRGWNIKEGGTYISNQVRMDTCHLTLKHCAHIFYSLQENPQRSPARLGKKKESLSHNKESWL